VFIRISLYLIIYIMFGYNLINFASTNRLMTEG